MDVPILKRAFYPRIVTEITDPKTNRVFILTNCCFEGLLESGEDDVTLAGMGLTIIGNICNALKRGVLQWHYDARLWFIAHPGDKRIELPWPGMPDDRPIKLDLAKMPFDTTMFFDPENAKFKYLPDRMALMNRIEQVWVPFLKKKMFFACPAQAMRALA